MSVCARIRVEEVCSIVSTSIVASKNMLCVCLHETNNNE